jgi:hypothetical protein
MVKKYSAQDNEQQWLEALQSEKIVQVGGVIVKKAAALQPDDKEALGWLKDLKAKGASDDEIEAALAEYESHVENEPISAKEMFEMKREAYKREKAVTGMEEGRGGFRRSKE